MVLVVRWFGLVGYDGRFVGLVVCYGGFACWFTGCLVVGFLVLVCLLWVSASVFFCLSGVRFVCVFVSLL